MKRAFLTLHWINFDTAIGAVITSLFVASYIQSSIPAVASLTLFLAVLSIYNFDHLMDARRVQTIAQSRRHRFYQENIKGLSIYQLVLMIGLMSIIWYLPFEILRAGLILALFTGVYFLLLFFVFPKRFLLKELMISVVYTMALFLAPIYSSVNLNPGITVVLLWLEILLIAIVNTLIFAWYDHDIDQFDGHTSLTGDVGKSTVYKLIILILTILIGLVIYQMVAYEMYVHQLIILAMAAILFYSLMARKRLVPNETYRVVGDAVFILPIIILLW